MSGDGESVPELWSDLDDEQREALLELADQNANQRVNRRDVLAGGAGLLGLGGLLNSVGRARAAPSGHSISVGPNGEGTLGGGQVELADTSSSPASAGQFRRNGSDVEVYSGGGVKNLSNIGSGGSSEWEVDGSGNLTPKDGEPVSVGQLAHPTDIVMVDDRGATRLVPEDHATPVQNAIDDVDANGGGDVRLPTRRVTEDGTIIPRSGVNVRGKWRSSSIEITATGVDGIAFDRATKIRNVILDGFALVGPGDDASTGHAIHHNNSNTVNLSVGNLKVTNWAGCGYRVASGVASFQCTHNYIRFDSVDAGNQDGVISWQGGGAPNSFNHLAFYPSSTSSGVDSDIIYVYDPQLTFGTVNVGGSAARALHQDYGNVIIKNINYEPKGDVGTADAIVHCKRNRPVKVGTIQHTTGTVNDAILFAFDSGKKSAAYIGRGGTVNNDIVNVNSDLTAPCHYDGSTADVNNTTGASLSNPVDCWDGGVT